MFKQLFGKEGHSTLVEGAINDVSSMLQRSAQMLDVALGVLLENKPLEVDLDAMDDEIDLSERMVRRSVLEHLSVNASQDLVLSLVLVSLVQDAERIGDFANGLSEVARIAQQPREGEFCERLRGYAARLRPLFEITERAFRDDDVELAGEVIRQHRELRAELKEFRDDVANSDLSANMAVTYASAAQILRRIGSHLSNISSCIVQPFDRIRHGDEDV